MSMSNDGWPSLSHADWAGTAETLHLWTQIVGKIRLASTPWLNHSWHVPFYLTARGLGTSLIPAGDEDLEFEFDFLRHRLFARMSDGAEQSLSLEPRSVADFYARVFEILRGFGLDVAVDDRPTEIPQAIRFPLDEAHAAYDARAAHAFWRTLLRADRLLNLFRSGFLGKASPVHFFWGSFDLAVTRFSGRRAPLHPGGAPGLSDKVVQEAYSHEVSSAGFWPGGAAYPHAIFYSYAYPEPPGFRAAPVSPPARFDETLGEFVLPYDEVRRASDPDAVVMTFLAETYAAAADLAAWDRAALDCALGVPGVPRPI
jgi:Family of unknown function (DUF5996)